MFDFWPAIIVIGAWAYIFIMKYLHKKKIKNRIEYRKKHEMSPEEIQKGGLRHPGGGGG
ncbi:hypothetical protein GLW08_02745 [Pontibacillus yanchengensis]|uniref:Uncharacterized protein n=2 Tax=Pontibacillus yanchengensis TaxID=462910 RepID=A0A6I5A2B5_9BACI|nr:hypothetical protein [Pontibacillus yanchengensis]MYL34762.1 hypothetical protein [Pontibacillus yanchengensis]MYL52252.1 hypothetical protein [Pontibacillus yanchengensis]